MREIKFRVWCKQSDTMNKVEKMGFEEGELWYVEDQDNETQPPYFEGNDDWVLMQYTGLKDKDDREIYESDVVKWERIIYTDCSRSEVDYVEEAIIGEIYYVDGITIGLKEADGTGRILFPFHLLDSSQDFEVLGNIYENKDLLTTT